MSGGGIPINRGHGGSMREFHRPNDACIKWSDKCTPGTWYPADLDAARERIVEAARDTVDAFENGDLYARRMLVMRDEIVAYDALRDGRTR